MKDRATTKQLILITFVAGMTLKIFLLPTLLLKSAGRDGLIVLAILLGVELLLLAAAYFVIKRSPDMTLTEALEKYLTKVGARVVALILVAYIALKLLLIFTETRSFFETALFEEFKWHVMALPLFALVAIVAAKSLSGVARLFEIFTPILIVVLIILAAMIIPAADFGNVLPLGTTGGGGIVRHTLSFPIWTGDFVLLALFVGKVRPQRKSFARYGIISAALACGFVMFFAILLTAAYGNIPHLIEYGHNARDLTILGSGRLTYGRIDMILYVIWTIGVIIKLFLYGYFAVYLLSYTFGLKGANSRLLVSGIMCLALYILTITVFASNTAAYEFVRTPIPRFFALGVQGLVLVGAVVFGVIWKKKNKVKSKR